MRVVFPAFEVWMGPFIVMELLWAMFAEPKEAMELLEKRKKELLLADGSAKRPVRLAAYA